MWIDDQYNIPSEFTEPFLTLLSTEVTIAVESVLGLPVG